MTMIKSLRPLRLLSLIAVAAACGDYDAPPAFYTWSVAVGDVGFDPKEIDVSPNQHVRWDWDPLSTGQHNVTFDDPSVAGSMTQTSGSFDSGFEVLGIYSYHCTIHPEMTGEVRVLSNLQPPFLP